ncbi:VOC family protein [Meiothermus taiwanensis]|jgi:catechol 2,3-dioxygenase-like lactoylglutathione lyase family enzyme|uniref:Glyoxalase/Bleomycin resistance protein/Dioxygenase superfamily protein n=2 Tax=Meiothermus taiwanensis TaxID=172827 RepID=A0A399DQW9_9DEIN|nr:VOC family protein [Meiothermus taiwanensis]AWR87034.1 glyoxalase/bleomycin resistance protein/dioxygenase [Meiothermus taiwanensis WR-220]KIQ54361.1 glyoxalase [Meiothermus taiwanensis]KZK14730.1 glyoxalase [Meiothermus taiwanensis]RIH74645.1 Glyoxalase/Bleomycin resistance protein/Dioxygenase superfamily protein [Meiothermus taiwanensis]
MKIAGVLETCVYASDLEAARGFYQGLLGLELFAEQPGRHLFFRAGPGVFLVFNPQATQQETALPPHGALGSVHVCFRVAAEELEGWAERLEAHGHPVTWAEWKAGRSLYVHDPAGNLIELAPAAIWGLPDGHLKPQ